MMKQPLSDNSRKLMGALKDLQGLFELLYEHSLEQGQQRQAQLSAIEKRLARLENHASPTPIVTTAPTASEKSLPSLINDLCAELETTKADLKISQNQILELQKQLGHVHVNDSKKTTHKQRAYQYPPETPSVSATDSPVRIVPSNPLLKSQQTLLLLDPQLALTLNQAPSQIIVYNTISLASIDFDHLSNTPENMLNGQHLENCIWKTPEAFFTDQLFYLEEPANNGSQSILPGVLFPGSVKNLRVNNQSIAPSSRNSKHFRHKRARTKCQFHPRRQPNLGASEPNLGQWPQPYPDQILFI
jgi:hypothetical protein